LQKKGLTKLLRLRYQILFRKGKENVVADVLSISIGGKKIISYGWGG
jgi:hypothetical protein